MMREVHASVATGDRPQEGTVPAAANESPSALRSVTGSGDDHVADEPTVDAAHPVHPYLHVVVVAVIGAVSVFLWLEVYERVNRLIWDNDFVTANPWMFPVICLPLSLLVGLLVKYRNAPNNLEGSMLDTFVGDVSHLDWRGLPLNIVAALVSLWSGAVLGPEGGIGGISSKIAALYSERVRIPVEHRSQLVFSTVASAYNGLIASPLFTGVLGAELIKDPEARARTLPANLIGGSIGFLIFITLGANGLQDYLHLPAPSSYTAMDLVLVVVFAALGLVLALIAGVLFRAAAAVMGRFAHREVERALLAGVIFSAVGMLAPVLLFSGESQIFTVVANAPTYGPLALAAMAIVKLGLLAVAFKSGFLGGPTFPAIFASTCVGLAISLLFPGLPVELVIGGVMAGFLVVLFRAPFMVILLTAVMLQADAELIAFIVLAVASVMIVQPYLMAVIAARQAARATGNGAAA